MKRFFDAQKALISFIVVLSLILGILPFGFSAAENKHTVTATAILNLRSSASKSSSVLKTLSEGAVMTLLEDSEDGWAHISGGGYNGYASTDYLDVPSDSDVVITADTTATINLREGRGTSYSVLTTIPKNTTVKVTDNYDEDWAGVKYGSFSGYASKEYLVIDLSLPKADYTEQPTVASATSTGAHRSASFSNIPTNTSKTDANSDNKLILDVSELEIDINGTHNLTAMDASSRPVTGGLSYKSNNTKVASVNTKGVVTGVSSGSAEIAVTNASTGAKAVCKVVVSSAVKSTVAPTQPPTSAPTAAPTQAPTTPTNETLSLSVSSDTVYKGCYYQIIAESNTTVSWSSSNSSIATVSGDGIVTALANGNVTITAKTSKKTASCKLNIISGENVSISHDSVTVSAGKTFLARAYTSGVTWTSSDTSVATVNNGYILSKKAGKTVVTVATSKGASSMLVNVIAAEPIRFAYTSPNCASKDQTVTLIAITDTTRTAVRFNVNVNGTTKTVNATSSTKDGNTLVWKGTTSFSSAGTYSVTAYSQYNNKWTTCDDGKTTAFVADSSDFKTTVCTKRRASDGVISLIANFEGFISSIYDDPITGDPTVGYGRVIFCGEQFYNTMTKNEAFAYLVQCVNNEGYATKVNSFLVGNNVKFNQQQFDALVCLVYNTGAGVLTGDTELRNALLDCHDGTGGKVSYYINGSYVRIRKGPGTDYDIIKELDNNTEVTVLSTENSAWYQVKLSDGTKGYVSSDYISKRATGGKLDLNYVDRQTLINKLCAYHHAGGGCVYGLLYRRVDEMEMFLYGDYDRNYGIYKYDIQFTCARNKSFHT